MDFEIATPFWPFVRCFFNTVNALVFLFLVVFEIGNPLLLVFLWFEKKLKETLGWGTLAPWGLKKTIIDGY